MTSGIVSAMPSRAAALPGSSDASSQSVAARRASLVSYSLSGMRYGASMVRVRFSGCAAFRLLRMAIPSTLKRARPHGPYEFFPQNSHLAGWGYRPNLPATPESAG